MLDPFDEAVSLASRIRRKEVSAVEVVSAYIDRIDRFNPALNAIIWRNDEEALAAARAADERTARGDDLPPFHGVPVPVKELNMVAGQPCTMGSLGIDPTPRTETDLSVQRLVEAGFILFGRSNSPEMGPMSVTENRRFGQTRNPWDTRLSPAGSSGGAAVAVAAGMSPIAHASDGGGSIRMPSSACGVVGLKPARGRVPQRLPVWEHATVDGAITRTVGDAAALLDVMSVPDRTTLYQAPAPERAFRDEVGRPNRRLRIGLMLDAPTGVPVDPECVQAAHLLAAELESQGHVVEPANPTLYSYEATMAYVDVLINAWLHHTPYDHPELAEPYIQGRMARAREFHAGEYVRAASLVHRESQQIVSQWGDAFDVLLTPTMATTPPPLGVVLAEANAQFDGPRLRETQMISFTYFSNLSGLPAITLPVHMSAAGVPVGAQLVAGPYDEATLVRLASAVEPAFDWAARTPVEQLAEIERQGAAA